MPPGKVFNGSRNFKSELSSQIEGFQESCLPLLLRTTIASQPEEANASLVCNFMGGEALLYNLVGIDRGAV
jgi:hypothetical protein